MKSVLVVATTPLQTDGLTSVLLNIAEIIVEQYRLVFALGENATPDVLDRLERLGEVHILPSRKQSLLAYFHALSKLAKDSPNEKDSPDENIDNGFSFVHIHGNSATMALDLLAVLNIPRRITHIHNCAKQPQLKQISLGKIMNRLVTDPVACSKASGDMMYTRPFLIINNGIDCTKFQFNFQKRKEIRSRLGLKEDNLVIGHIGQFNKQKNQIRLLSIYAELTKHYPNARLILCGSGEMQEECRRTAEELKSKVIFLPETKEPELLYAAMDLFVMPSLFEGLPLAGIEAQANGLPCIFSDTITQEVRILDSSRFVSLSSPDSEWTDTILKLSNHLQIERREACADIVAAAGYSIQTTKGQVRKLYG